MLTKIIFTLVIAYLGWKAFSMMGRIQEQRKKQDEQNLQSGGKKQAGVEDMVECPVCNTYTPRGSKSCGKESCPFEG